MSICTYVSICVYIYIYIDIYKDDPSSVWLSGGAAGRSIPARMLAFLVLLRWMFPWKADDHGLWHWDVTHPKP